VFNIIREFYNIINTQFGTRIKVFRLDNAKEFRSSWLEAFCFARGIILEYSSTYTPAQNGIAERLNLFLLERIIIIYATKNIPLKL